MAEVIYPVTEGKDFNYFKEFSVIHDHFPDSPDENPQVIIRFRGNQNLKLMILDAGKVEYSFNGSTVHGTLEFGKSNASLDFLNRANKKIWFRYITNTPTVRVEAWRV